MLCCARCGSTVCRGERVTQCGGGMLYQVWGEQGVIPSQFRRSIYQLSDHFDAMSRGKRGLEDFRVICCACHLASDYHLHSQAFLDTSCARCRMAVDCGFENVRHHMRVVRLLMQ